MTATGEEIRAWALADLPGRDLATLLRGPEALELVVELAHDLRSPLSSVLVLAELLQAGRCGPLNALQQEQVRLMHSAVRSLCAITEDVMALARAGQATGEQGTGACEPGARVPFAVNDVIASVCDVARPMAAARGIELRMRSTVRKLRTGHPRALERVLLNLVTNAIKFTDEGFVEIGALPERAEPEQVRFAVTDSGRGISTAAARALLDPFPAGERSRRYSGTGIGLSICRRLVSAMGASLMLDSRVAGGSRFHFTLTLPFARD
jgi:signal transduction histidine kinase